MPSFDIVSEYNNHEAGNAIDQANREVSTRFDFKGTNAEYSLKEDIITLKAAQKFQLQQMMDILIQKLSRRGIDVGCLNTSESRMSGQTAIQEATLKQGLDSELARKIVKDIKTSKQKVQSAIQGDKVRISGKKRDDLQQVIAFLKEKNYDLPLQFNNFRT